MSFYYKSFENYKNECVMFEHEIEGLRDYLAGQLIGWSPNFHYYQAWYNECNNLCHVVLWRKEKYGLGTGKFGERVCYKNCKFGVIIDLTKDPNHIKENDCTCNKLDV